MAFQQAHEVCTKEHRKCRVHRRPRLCASHRVIEQREIAEESAWPKFYDLSIAGTSLPADKHAAFDNDVNRFTLIAFIEDHLILDELTLVQQRVDNIEFAGRQIDEQRQSAQAFESRGGLLIEEQAEQWAIPSDVTAIV